MNERIERQFAHWLVRGSRLLDGDFFFLSFRLFVFALYAFAFIYGWNIYGIFISIYLLKNSAVRSAAVISAE